MHGAAGGTPNPGNSNREGSSDERRGRRNNKPTKPNKKAAKEKKSDNQKYREATEDQIRFSMALGKAIKKSPNVQINCR